MNKTNPAAKLRGRDATSGFTLVELLVVIAIIGLLVGLLLPAVQSARARARLLQCTNQIGQAAKAIVNYETSKQRYPGYVQRVKRSDGTSYVGLQVNGLNNSEFVNLTESQVNNGAAESLISWAAVILPQMGRNDIYDVMVDATTAGPAAQIVAIGDYICPDDTELTALPGSAGLTYVVNTGVWDWYTPTGNLLSGPYNQIKFNDLIAAGGGDTKNNGLFHNRTFGNVKTSMAGIKDGASNTMLLSENVHKEVEPGTVGLYTWAGVGSDLNSPGEQQLGMVWLDPQQYDPASGFTANPFLPPNPSTPPPQYPFSVDDITTASYPFNSPLYARPASNHPQGSFNAAFADGNVRTLNSDIDYTVYQRLMTPEGRKATDPVTGNVSIYKNLAPLGADDLQ